MNTKYPTLAAFEAKLHPGEPWFVIRGQDVFAPAAVQAYASLSQQHHELHPMIGAIVRWQEQNPTLVKKPD